MPDYRMKAESGEFRLTGQDARLIHTIISRVVKKNWWLIGLYATITVGGVLALVTFLIGLRMMHQVTYGLAWRHSSWTFSLSPRAAGSVIRNRMEITYLQRLNASRRVAEPTARHATSFRANGPFWNASEESEVSSEAG